MSKQDTVRLMRQCSAGIKMAVSAIDEVSDKVCCESFKAALRNCRIEHIKLQQELELLLNEYGEEDKEPGPIAKSMAWVKTNINLIMSESDSSIADLITDGCNMGIKGLNRFLNKFDTADQRSKDITVKLCDLEEKLVRDLRPYL